MKMNELDKINEALAEEARKAEKTILDMIQDVYDGKLLIISDDDNNIIGINCPIVAKGITNTQKVGPHMVMGNSAENMHEDEIELKKFMKSYENNPTSIMHMFNIAL